MQNAYRFREIVYENISLTYDVNDYVSCMSKIRLTSQLILVNLV